jgi:putative ABC transport system ATP-binding protein
MGALELQGVVKHYRGPSEVVRAVDGVTLTVEPGEIVVLFGPSGSGKSTLLMLAAGLLSPDAGAVRFDGRDLSGRSARELGDYQRREVGFIYQSAHLMSGVPTVENAAIKLLADRVPLRKARREAVPWLERVGLGRRLDHTPEQLSGGERQRVAVARALVNSPRLILADEPTGSLDSRRGLEILSLLAELCRERRTAVLLATHDLQAAEITDRAYTLKDGRIAEEDSSHGPLEAVLPLPKAARG